MKHGIYTALAVSLCFVALSCSEETETSMMGGISNALVQTADFTPTDDFSDLQTRSAIDPTASPIAFSWVEGDKLAVYSVAQNGMTNFELDLSKLSNNPSVATFKASGFNLKGGDDYLAFSPYSGSNTDKTKVAVSYDGIVQEGNGTYSHLGAYDYQWAKAKAEGSTEAANIKFNFKHAGAICRFRINGLPQGTKFSRMTITCDGIITKGTVDLTQEESPNIVAADGNSTTQSIKFGESGFGADDNGTLTVYTMMAPANLSGKNISLSLYSGDMILVSFSVKGKDMLAGNAYAYSATYTAPSAPSLPDGLGYVDLGLRLNDKPVLFANQIFSKESQWAEQDPVTAAWGLNWRTATNEELAALFDNNQSMLSWKWREDNKGVLVTNIQEGHPCKGNSLFLPMNYCEDDLDKYYEGYYWCSKANGSNYAYFYKFHYDYYSKKISLEGGNDGKTSNYAYLPIYIGPTVNNNKQQ